MKVNAFVTELNKKGYSTIYHEEDISGYVLEGTFAGIHDCEIYVLGTPKSKTTWKVVVKFPEKNSWYLIKNDYNELVESYTKKYGKPKDHREFFSYPYEDGDGYEMTAISTKKCHYITMYETDVATIDISIEKGYKGGAYIRVSYEDKINTDLRTNEKNEIINDDI